MIATKHAKTYVATKITKITKGLVYPSCRETSGSKRSLTAERV
jgi:hypothetical protein